MATLQTLHSAVQVLQEQMREAQVHIVILYARQRHLRNLTQPLQNSQTYGKTGPTSSTSTAVGRASLWRRTAKFLPALLRFLAEKALQFFWPTIGGILLSLWALIKHYGDAIWQYLLASWHWLVG